MSDKLINRSTITTQVEFDEFGGFTLTEVLDADVLEAVGGGDDIKIPIPAIPPINVICWPTTNNCPPPTPAPPPAPTPTPKPPEPPKQELDGDEG